MDDRFESFMGQVMAHQNEVERCELMLEQMDGAELVFTKLDSERGDIIIKLSGVLTDTQLTNITGIVRASVESNRTSASEWLEKLYDREPNDSTKSFADGSDEIDLQEELTLAQIERDELVEKCFAAETREAELIGEMEKLRAELEKLKTQQDAQKTQREEITAELLQKHIDDGMMQKDIAAMYGLAPARISQLTKKWKIRKCPSKD